MKTIKIGDTQHLNLGVLLETKLAVLANSGGGKSYAIRRIVEQAFGQVQIVILDPEGEYGNLRERYDFVLAGEGGETIAKPHVAAKLAEKLMELKASCIVDIYDLLPQDRKRFVRLFLESLMNLPKHLQTPVLVILDEAHVFAPEGKPSEATAAVESLASQGRKRNIGAIFATQRISKMAKDVLAECNNKMIGRMNLDIDRKRAGEELGFSGKEQVLSLRNLKPGQFYMFGPAVSDDVVLGQVGPVKILPPKRGSLAASSVVPPTEGVRKILAKLADLPQEAQREARTVSELQAEVQRLRRAPAPSGKPTAADIQAALEPHLVAFATERNAWKIVVEQWEEHVGKIRDAVNSCVLTLRDLDKSRPSTKPGATYSGKVPAPKPVAANPPEAREIVRVAATLGDGTTGPEQKILDAIALSESIGIAEPEQTAVAFLAGYTYGGGGFNNPRGALKTRGLVEYRGSRIALTESGRAIARRPDAPLTDDTMRERVMSVLPNPEQRLLGPLMDAWPSPMSNEDLAAASAYAAGSGGFNNPKGRLRTLGLIEYPSSGYARARDLLFPETR